MGWPFSSLLCSGTKIRIVPLLVRVDSYDQISLGCLLLFPGCSILHLSFGSGADPTSCQGIGEFDDECVPVLTVSAVRGLLYDLVRHCVQRGFGF